MKRSLRKEAGLDGTEAHGQERAAGRNGPEAIGRSADALGHSADSVINADGAELLAGYAGKSESELYAELADLTARQKADGSFDPASIQRGVEAISPMLNSEQRRKLNDIINSLR